MKKTFTAKITLSGTAIASINEIIVQSLITNAINNWLADAPEYLIKDRPQLITLHKVQVVKEEIDTE